MVSFSNLSAFRDRVVSAQVQGVDKMLAVLENALEQYNESNAVMDLVLFEDAMKHIARISRADSEQKMSFNVTWSRRWRRRGAAPP